MKAIRVHQPGEPDVMQIEEVSTPMPAAGEVLIAVAVASVNYADVGLRRGMMGGPHHTAFPYTPGFEVAGKVVALGAGVSDLPIGMRVAAVLEAGAYAEYAVTPARRVIPIPDQLDFATALALLIQGATAYGVIHDAARLQPGERVLVEAAAGGVGSLAIQLAKLAGAATVIGAASSGKVAYVRSLGVDHAVDYTQPGWTEHVMAATDGQGVDVVLESVGGVIGAQAFGCLAPLGRAVIYGSASGQPLPLQDLMLPLAMKGLAISGFGGPWLRHGRAEHAARELGRFVQQGRLKVQIGATFPLAQAANAHRALESRETTGKVLLLVDSNMQ